MKKLILILAATVAAVLPLAAQTAPENGGQLYVSGFGGANFLPSLHGKGELDGSVIHARANAKTGYFAGAAVGYKIDNYRLEAEFSTRHNRFNKFKPIGFVKHVDYASYSYMVNAYYDFDFCNVWNLKPYVGAGLGYTHGSYKQKTSLGESLRHDRWESDNFSWQLISGVAYPITDKIDLAVEYRYVNTGKNKMYRGRHHNNDVGAVVRYWF